MARDQAASAQAQLRPLRACPDQRDSLQGALALHGA
eukprot:CAMPEP_0172598982 /NCGR_PEP_ID=MMETSP1068-20121228/19096_1 /TAXON_ID=35684 /ORGANISM="Pseudopedinella elastica, Strain CCMP716" /LENGTH=35 /DNA_ID= /DNA_START= /DNA_END= /DNA_ORIENTATION=